MQCRGNPPQLNDGRSGRAKRCTTSPRDSLHRLAAWQRRSDRRPERRSSCGRWRCCAVCQTYRGRAFARLRRCSRGARQLAVRGVRRMIDFGFSPERLGLIDRYFAVMIAVRAVLAGASALRFYLVTTLASACRHLREAVFSHLTGLSQVFFDSAKIRARWCRGSPRHHADQVGVGSSVSVALRNLVWFIGSAAMMV